MPQEHDRQRLLRPVLDPHRHQHLRLHQRLHNRAQRSLLPSELLLADYYTLGREILYYGRGRPRAVNYWSELNAAKEAQVAAPGLLK